MARVSYLRASFVCLTAGMLVGYQFLLQGIPSIMVQSLQNAFHISLTQVGILSSSMLYLYILLQGKAGKLAQRYGERRCIIVSLTAMSSLCVIFACAQNYFSALVIRVLMGVFAAPGVVCSIMLISRWFPIRLFAVVAGVWESLNMCFAASGPAVMGRLVPEYGWRSTLLIIAGVGVVILLLNIVFVRDHPDDGDKVSHYPAEHGLTDSTHESSWRCLIALLQTPLFVFSCLFCFGLFAVINVFASLWAVPFMRVLYPEHQMLATQSVSFIFIGAAIGAPVTGAMVSYLNRSRGVMLGCVLWSLVCLTLLLYVRMPIGMTSLFMLCFGISCSAYMLPFTLIRKELPASWLYTANAVLNSCSIIAAPVLQPLIGKLLALHAHHASMLQVSDFRVALLSVYFILWLAFFSVMRIKEKPAITEPMATVVS